jgi:hypothetical protein
MNRRRWLISAAVALGLALVAVAIAWAVGDSPPDDDGGDAVAVWNVARARPAPCPPIDRTYPTMPIGGCKVAVESGPVAVTIRSAIGDMRIESCTFKLELLVDASGATMADGIRVSGDSPCNDLGACDYKEPRPWRGRIERGEDGRLHHVLDACFDTCFGRFVGELTLSLERIAPGVWRQRADRALVGRSGYQLDGAWRVGRGGVDFRPPTS